MRHRLGATFLLAQALVTISCLGRTPVELLEDGSASTVCELSLHGGVHVDTQEGAGGALELTPGALSGTFTSAACDAGISTRWHTLALLPEAPYCKPLLTADESGYAQGALSSSQLLALWHLDGEGAVDEGASFAEATGKTGPAAATDAPAGALTRVPGRLGEAVAWSGGTLAHLRADAVGTDDAEELSVCAWVRLDRYVASEQDVLVANRDSQTGRGWQLALTPYSGCHARSNAIVFSVDRQSCGEASAEEAYALGRWTHYCGTFRGGQFVRVYQDGVRVGETVSGVPLVVQSAPGQPVGLGTGLPFGDGTLDGALDEVAIWTRALSDDEVLALWSRGGQCVRVGLRACAEPTCAGVPFAGPSGLVAERFAELTDVGPPRHSLQPELVGRYLQVEVQLTTEQAASSPRLLGFEVEGSRSR